MCLDAFGCARPQRCAQTRATLKPTSGQARAHSSQTRALSRAHPCRRGRVGIEQRSGCNALRPGAWPATQDPLSSPQKDWIEGCSIGQYRIERGAMGEAPAQRGQATAMRERDEPDREKNYDDPDAEPWTGLALIVLLALICLILIARFALIMIAG